MEHGDLLPTELLLERTDLSAYRVRHVKPTWRCVTDSASIQTLDPRKHCEKQLGF